MTPAGDRNPAPAPGAPGVPGISGSRRRYLGTLALIFALGGALGAAALYVLRPATVVEIPAPAPVAPAPLVRFAGAARRTRGRPAPQ